jgi:hypothetical protein
MDEPDLTEEELRRVLAACRPLRLGDRVPGYLQEFLAVRLEAASCPDLAARVRALRGEQAEALWAALRRRQGGD